MKRFKLITRYRGLKKEVVVLVDDEDAHHLRAYEWSVQHSDPWPYIYRRLPGRAIQYLHHQILGTTTRTYHRNGNSLDNRQKNLTTKCPGNGPDMRDLYRLFEKEPTWR